MRPRRWVLATTIAVAILLIGGMVAHYAANRPGDVARDTLSELEVLRAQDGLYYAPELRSRPEASLYDSAYGLAILRLSHRSNPVQVNDADISKLRESDTFRSPVWRAWYLSSIEADTARRIVTAEDLRDIEELRTEAGSFLPRKPEPGETISTAEEIAATAAAVDVLSNGRDPGSSGALTGTSAWLTGMTDMAAKEPFLAGLVSRSLNLLGKPVPAVLVASVLDWYNSVRGSKAPTDYQSTARGLYGYALVLTAAGRPSSQRDADFWRPLFEQAKSHVDLQLAFYVAVGWRFLGGSEDAIAGLADRVSHALLPGGLVGLQATYVGSIYATYMVTKLRLAAGLSARDERLENSLLARRDVLKNSGDPLARARWLATLRWVGGEDDASIAGVATRGLRGIAEQRVTITSAKQWYAAVDAARSMDLELGQPTVEPWDLGSRQGIASAAYLVLGLHDAGVPLARADWVRPEAMLAGARSADRTPTVAEYFNALLACLYLGGAPTAEIRQEAQRAVTAALGCDGLPSLLRLSPDAETCDLGATVVAVTTQKVIGSIGLLFAEPGAEGAN